MQNIISKKHNCKFYHSKNEKQTHFPQKIYKLSKTNWTKLIHTFFSHFEGTRGEKKIFRTLVPLTFWINISNSTMPQKKKNMNLSKIQSKQLTMSGSAAISAMELFTEMKYQDIFPHYTRNFALSNCGHVVRSVCCIFPMNMHMIYI